MRDEQDNTSDPWAAWRGRIGASRKMRDPNVSDWKDNVDRRKSGGAKGTRRTNAADSTVTRAVSSGSASVNKDWPLTKAKIALLFSQTPEIRTSSDDQQAASVLPAFARDLNKTIRDANVGAAIEEELADVINASGIGGVIIACEKRTETKDVPQFDPMVAAMSGIENPMVPVTNVADIRYPVRRLSPASLLIPSEFTGSVYDQARWLGYEDSLPWATAKAEFGLSDDVKEEVCGKDRKVNASNTLNGDTSKFTDTDAVNFTELFYWRHFYHEDETSFSALQRLVFVDGINAPVIDEAYQGQQRTPDGQIVGVKRNPIQILTLTYISDDALPPSDSTISRSDVNELEEMHEQFALQRKHSIPIRGYNPDMVSHGAKAKIERGEYQDWIPIRGQFERAVGQIAPAAFPAEKPELLRFIEAGITEKWTVGPNQSGGFSRGEQSAREVSVVERNFQTRIGLERAKVERHVLAIAEVLGGLMALHGATQIPPEALGSIAYSIAVDSTVLLDAEQQSAKLEHLIDRLAQSPYADVRPLVSQWLALHGQDPSKIIIEPQPKPPDPVNISMKGDDLMNPMALAFAYRTGQGPSPEDLAASIKAFQAALSAVLTGQVPAAALTPADDRPPRDGESPGMANADWQMAPRMDKRDEDGGA